MKSERRQAWKPLKLGSAFSLWYYLLSLVSKGGTQKVENNIFRTVEYQIY